MIALVAPYTLEPSGSNSCKIDSDSDTDPDPERLDTCSQSMSRIRIIQRGI